MVIKKHKEVICDVCQKEITDDNRLALKGQRISYMPKNILKVGWSDDFERTRIDICEKCFESFLDYVNK